MATEQEQLAQQEVDQQRFVDIEREVAVNLPPDIPASDEPIETLGDYYDESEEKPFSSGSHLQKLRETRQASKSMRPEHLNQFRSHMQNVRKQQDPRQHLRALRSGRANDAKQKIDNDTFDPNAKWVPKTYKEYAAERDQEGTQIDPVGFSDKSLLNTMPVNKLVKTGYRWMLNKFGSEDMRVKAGEISPTYLAETQVEGRKIAMKIIDDKLKQMGNVTVTDYKKRREAEDLWNRKYELQYQNALDVAMAEASLPSMEEFQSAIMDNPEEFLKGVAQEIINKPELLFVPEAAAVRGAYAAGMGAKALGASAKTVQVAKFIGAGGGAYAGGVTLGTIDRVVEQGVSTGEVDVMKAAEQAQIDGLLGMAIVGGGKVITKGTSFASDYAKAKGKANEFAREAMKNRELDLEQVRRTAKVEEALADTATETYADINGNTYTFEIRETNLSTNLKSDIDQLNKYKSKYHNDPQALEAIQSEIKAKKKELETEQLTQANFTKLTNEIQALTERTKELQDPMDVAVNWKLATEKKPKVTQDFMKFTDKDGVEHTLKRVTPEMLHELSVKAPGIKGIDFSPNAKVKDANSKFIHLFKEQAINVTAPLRRLGDVSPTAKLLIDKLDPRAGTKGRHFTYTIPEEIHYRQGMFMDESVKLQEMLEINLGKEGHEALRKHMRGVELSDNPVVLEVAQGYRNLLDKARDYAKARGMKVDEAKDFLPRYYNRDRFKDPAARQEFVSRFNQVVDAEGNPKYNLEDVRNSAEKIAKNIIETSDEVKYLQGTETVNPVGNRKWKDVPDSMLDDFLDDNFVGSINRYLMNTANRAEIDYVFGYGGKDIDDMLSKITKEAEAKGRDLTKQEVNSIRDLYKLMNGSLDNGGTMKAAADAALMVQNFLKLPLVTLTSALEPTTLLFRLNESSGVKGLVNAYGGFKARKLFGDMSTRDIEIEARQMGLVHEAAVKERLDAMVGEGLEGLPAKMNNKLMKTFMLHQWTEHTRTIAYEAARNDLLKTIKKLARDPNGPASESRRRILTDNNIDPDLALDWVSDGASRDHATYTAIKRGAARLTNTAIVNPTKTNKAKWLSSTKSHYRLAGQFKSFGSVFSNDVAKETFDESVRLWNEGRKIKAMNKVGKMLAVVSAMTYWTTYDSAIIYGEGATGDDEAGEIALKMAKGVAGMVVPGNSMIAPVYGGRDLASALGPTASDLSNVMQGRVEPKYYAPSYVKAIEKIQEEDY